MKCLTHRLARWIAAALLLTTACSQRPTTGSAQLFGSLSQAASAEDVTRVEVTISAADMTTRTEALTKTDGAWGGTLGDIPAGTDRTFTADAFDSAGTKRFSGQATHVTITAGTTTVVALSLQSLDSPAPFDNAAPLIDSLTASTSTVSPGGALLVEATAHDPNPGDTLSYAWTASAGAFYSPYSPTSTWAAPSTPGLVTLTLTVTDPKGSSASISFTVQVQSGSGGASVDLHFNTSPAVTGISASPTLVSAGETSTVTATATDGDGDALSYQWTAACAGSWTDASSATARFVPGTASTGATCADCPLTVTVTDGHGGQTTGTLHICVGPKTGVRLPPRIEGTYQSSRTVPASGTVVFRVTASDPLGSALSFSWSASTGTLGSTANSATQSEVTWAPPACVPSDGSPSLTATVTNAQGLSTSTTFSVTGGTACSGTSGGWIRTGSPSWPRVVGHTATLLPSGKVLVAAGVHMGMGALDTSEVYDPATGTWAPPRQMAMRRMDHTATLLPSGKVLVAGGQVFSGSGDPGGPSATAELYDPATDTWTATGSMLSPRQYHTATLLPSGRVLVAGGNGNTAELYDPATGTWTATGAMNTSRQYHSATLLPSGKVLVAGGTTSTGASPATEELYDPATGTWTPTGALGASRAGHTATLLQTGRVLVVGGQSNNTELYDPATGTWAASPSTTAFMYRSTATLLPSGKVLVVGVDVVNGTGFAELYDPVINTGSPVGNMASNRAYHTATLLPSGKVLVAGGDGTHSAELYDPATRTWVPTGAMSTPRTYHTATLLPMGKVLVAGGSGDNTAELYDPATGTWASTGAMSIPRTYHTATLLPSGLVLVEGGGDTSAELYDPATGTWSPTGGKSTNHAAPHTATLLPSGKVLVAGGDDNSAELYDPATGTWSPTGSMTVGRLFHTATLLPSGKVLVVGSVWGDNSAELYDPATGTWAPAANMTLFRGIQTATLLPSGKVLVAGGSDPYGPPRPTLEAYDPATGTWEVMGTLICPRWAHTATLLPSGQLLLAGGISGGYGPHYTQAELFSP